MKIAIQIIMLIFGLGFVMQAQGQSPERAAWLAERREMIARARTISDGQAILDLSRIVRGIGNDLPNASEEAKQLYGEALDLLKAIPGHAEYYRDKLDQANDVRKAAIPSAQTNDNGATDHGVKLLKFMNARDEAFLILKCLPSPETVRVLGRYLEDEWVSPLPFDKPHWFEKPLAAYAAGALSRLPLVNKPVKRTPPDRGDPENDLKAWQHWYEQIKSGKRTFRFEGDPQEYDLNGPAPMEKLVRIERDRKRDDERAGRSSQSGSGAVRDLDRLTSSPGSTGGIIAAILGIMAAGWYYWRKKTRKMGSVCKS